MKIKLIDKRIAGVLSVVPKNCVRFIDEVDNYGFSRDKTLNLQSVMGFNERRIVAGEECASDLVLHGWQHLSEKKLIEKSEIGALVFITQTPDHFMPPTSAVLHGKLGLSNDVLCFDISQGCMGYLYGLLQSFILLNSLPEGKKVVLMNGDTLSRRACRNDRNIYPMIGDAAAITLVENCPGSGRSREILIDIRSDGTRSDWLIIPAGGFRKPSTEKTREIKTLPDGNKRSDDDFYMNGAGIFMFTQTDVPALIQDFFRQSSVAIDDINYFVFHQPNRFMLEKLAKKLSIPTEKMPMNIVENFGNSSSAATPLVMAFNLSKQLLEGPLNICFAGFGVGLSWGVLTMDVGPLEFCDWIEV